MSARTHDQTRQSPGGEDSGHRGGAGSRPGVLSARRPLTGRNRGRTAAGNRRQSRERSRSGAHRPLERENEGLAAHGRPAVGSRGAECPSLPARRQAVKRKLDYDVLAEAYEDALARIEILEEYAMRMLKLCDFRKYEP